MKKLYPSFVFILSALSMQAQPAGYKSIMQQQSEYYSHFHFSKQLQWDSLDKAMYTATPHATTSTERPQGCTLTKRVFGWLPYWTTTGEENNLNASLLSDVAYFSYEVDATTGNYTSIHSWTTDAFVTKALSSGVKVHLTATLFSNHATFFGSTTSENTFITTIINLVNARGASGVNIDFEGVPSSQSANLTAFMERLCDSVHARVPGGEVTVAAPAVNWSSTWNVSALKTYVDLWLIMGYDYYYGGSPNAGPCSPLTGGGMWGSYDCSQSVIYYLSQGVPNSKVALGVPYYGYDWPTSSAALNATTTGTGTAVLYKSAVANAVTYGRKWDNYGMVPYYTYGSYHQCWYDDDVSLSYKYNMVNIQNIAGIGIWALGYDDGYSTAWNAIQNYFTTCATVPCSGEFRDLGDTGNYYNGENWTWTLAPTSATAVSATFSSFSTTTGDILSIYNGPTTASPLLGSYQGTTGPGTVTGTSGSLTFHFSSSASGATSSGWKAQWLCSGPGSCGPAIGLNATSVTTTSAMLNWTTVGSATSYWVKYKATTASVWDSISTTATSIPVSGLSPATSYEFEVRAICSSTGNYSSPASFTTACLPPIYATLPYNTSFENTWIMDSCNGGAQRVPDMHWRSSTGGTTPDGDDYWHRDDYTGTDWTNTTAGAYTPTASNGTYSARFHNDPPPAGSSGMLDLYVNLSPAGTKTISFDYMHNEVSPSPFSFNVLLSTDGGNTFPDTLLTITSAQMASWTTQTITTTATSATSVIRFKVTDKGTHDVGIDNLNISTPTGIEQVNGDISMNVFPNPFRQNFTIAYNLAKTDNVAIYLIDMYGRKIAMHSSENEAAGRHTYVVNFNSLNLAKGIYLVHIQTGSGNAIFRVIAQ